MQRYVIAGLQVASELPIPAADRGQHEFGSDIDVTIKLGEPPRPLANAKYRDEWLEIGDREAVLRPKTGLAFAVRDGSEITVHRTPDIADSDVHLFLVGSVWGLLCHQRRILPLHCSAIELDGRAIAFTGVSGAGKSTLAAGLSKRGYLHLCDDVCVLEQAGKAVRLLPMPKGIKLWGDASEALDVARGAAISSDRALDKFYVSLPEYEGREELDISALYVLAYDDTKSPGICALTGSDKFQEVLASLYRYHWMTMMRDPAEVFEQVAAAVRTLRVFRFSRPREMSRFDEGAALLQGHMRTIPTEA